MSPAIFRVIPLARQSVVISEFVRPAIAMR